MKVKLLVDTRVCFAKGAEIEVDEREAVRLLSLGFAAKVETAAKVEVIEKAVKVEDAEIADVAPVKKPVKKAKKK